MNQPITAEGEALNTMSGAAPRVGRAASKKPATKAKSQPRAKSQSKAKSKSVNSASKKAAGRKKKATTATRSGKAPESPRRRAEDRYAEALRREVIGIAILAVSLCMLLALASFHPQDVIPDGPAALTGRTRNLIGPVGAHAADVLLHIFGLAAFLLPLTLAVPGLLFLIGRRVAIKILDVVGYPLLVLSGGMLAHLWMKGALILGHDAGGLIGTTAAEILRSLIGTTGAYIMVYAALALTFVLTTRISIVALAKAGTRPVASPFVAAKQWVNDTRAALKLWWADLLELRLEKREARVRIKVARRQGRLEAREAKRLARKARRKAAVEAEVEAIAGAAADTAAEIIHEAEEAVAEINAEEPAPPRERRGFFGLRRRKVDQDLPPPAAEDPALQDDEPAWAKGSGGFVLGEIADEPSPAPEPAVGEVETWHEAPPVQQRRARRHGGMHEAIPTRQPRVTAAQSSPTPPPQRRPRTSAQEALAPQKAAPQEAAPQAAVPPPRIATPPPRMVTPPPRIATPPPRMPTDPPVMEAGDIGVQFEDPLDQMAHEGPTDTVMGEPLDPSWSPTPEPQRSVQAPPAPQAQPEPEGDGQDVADRVSERMVAERQRQERAPTRQVNVPPPTKKKSRAPRKSRAPEPTPAAGVNEEGLRPVVKERLKRTEEPSEVVVEEPKQGYVVPPLSFLDYERPDDDRVDAALLQGLADRLVQSLETFRIAGRVTEIHPGPVVTMFEFEPAPGVRISKIAGLADDLAMALKAIKVRIVAPIPGKGVVGFEVPNKAREMVYLKEIIGDSVFRSKKNGLPIALGKDIHGAPVVADLARMPHLLVAGTTGSGKSVGVNGMIASMLYHAGPEEIRMIMVDPKMLELSIYEGIPHLLLPVVTDPKKAALALKWAVDEMERRYGLMKDAGVRNIRGYNTRLDKEADARQAAIEARQEALEAQLSVDEGMTPAPGELDTVAEGLEAATPELLEPLPEKLPYIVVIIDEFADLMMVAGKEVEYCVARIAQKARAAGIHLILATQRPSTDVITGVIKANFPTRIAFQVSSGIDSRTILSTNGAENLLGKGDMLYMPPGTARLTRVHGAFVSEEELHQVVDFIKVQGGEPDYLDESVLAEDGGNGADGDGDEDFDEAWEDAVRVVFRDGRASTSHLQRRLSLGYNRAARIIDCMEREGLVGPGQGAKPREIHKQVIGDLIARWDGVH